MGKNLKKTGKELTDSIKTFLLDKYLFGSYARLNRMLISFLEVNDLAFEFKSLISYFHNACERKLRPRTIQVYKSQIRRILEEMIKQDPENFSTLQRYSLEQTFKHLKPGTIQTRAIPEEKTLSAAEITLLIERADKRLSLIIRFLAMTGVRIFELASIQKYDCEELANTVRITFIGKRKKQRTISIKKEYYHEILDTFQSIGPLFCKTTLDEYCPSHLNRLIKDLGFKVLNKKITAHMFRHSFATNMKASGYDLQAIADWLGHSDKRITDEMYNHPAPLTADDLPDFEKEN